MKAFIDSITIDLIRVEPPLVLGTVGCVGPLLLLSSYRDELSTHTLDTDW